MRRACILAASAALAQTPAPPASNGVRAAQQQQRAAIALQREAARKQAQTVGVWRLPWSPAPAILETPCDPLSESAVAPTIAAASTAQNLEPKLLQAVIEEESGYYPCAISSAGAMGLMQLMPATVEQFEVKDAFEPRQNVEAGAKYLKQLIDRYHGDLAQALGAYNAGPTTVDRAGGVPDISETVNYVDAILRKLGTEAGTSAKPPPPAPPPALPASPSPPASPPPSASHPPPAPPAK